MKTKSEHALRLLLSNVGYSERTVDEIMRWYTFPEEAKLPNLAVSGALLCNVFCSFGRLRAP